MRYRRFVATQLRDAAEPFRGNGYIHEAIKQFDADEQDESDHVEGILTAEEVARITSLEDLIAFFKIDTTRWQVRDFRVNKWEQAAKIGMRGKDEKIVVTPLYQVRANLIPNIERQVEIVREITNSFIEDAKAHAPVSYLPTIIAGPSSDLGEPCLFELSVFDAHLGMLAWAAEVGESYDTKIAVAAYERAVDNLLLHTRNHPVERILYIVGNDFLHVDGPGLARKGGATSAGTPQDIDSRTAKMFTTGRRALVAGIDKARTIAPVDVIVVPGNHDGDTMYKMGETLSAWYRNCADVDVRFSPMKRKFYGYGRNAFMFTHGEEYNRSGRDNLPLIFATECPAEIWVASEGGSREVHTGHNHINKEGKYLPTSESNETRAIRTRSLPGLTATDSWHFEQGYKHRRAATALVYKREGGFCGLYEFAV
jgi:hypothetical protein